MANLTVAIEDELLLRARKRALDNGTSVNALVRVYLETFAGDDKWRSGERSSVRHARSGVRWTARTGAGPAMISTTVTLFVDTNVFVYLIDGSDEAKASRVEQLMEDASVRIVVSPQAMGELFVTLQRKMTGLLSDDESEEHVRSLAPRCAMTLDQEVVLRPIETSRRHQLSYWDSLIIETAREAGCSRVATEDLSHGAVIRDVEIWNPFADVA